MNAKLRISLVALLLFHGGCVVHKPVSADREQVKIDALAGNLLLLDKTIDEKHAALVSRTAILYSRELAARYEISGSPRYHNLLINLGAKERGLCHHWTDDLLAKMQELKSDQFDFHSAVAHQGSDLFEHSSVVVTFKARAFETGIVLDAWRYSGNLYWSAVNNDRYQWSPRYPKQLAKRPSQ